MTISLIEGSFLHSENEQIIVDKLHSEKIEEVYQEKSKIINPSISEMVQLMQNLNDYQRTQASSIKEALKNGYNSKVISKIEKEISAFLKIKEIESCIQEMNENTEKLDKSKNNFSDIVYDNPDEKSMPQEILYKYHSTSQMMGEQIHEFLSHQKNSPNFEDFL